MGAYALPVVYAVLVWWFSTGLILLLDHRPRATHAGSMVAGTGVLALALWAIGASAGDASAGSAYIAFTAALLVWGWQEMSYYMGFVSGPRAVGCPPGARGFARFRAAAATSLWHEAAIVAGGVMIFQPETGLRVLTIVVIVYLIADGVSQILFAVPLAPGAGGFWVMASGILSVVLGVLIWRQWPVSGESAVGILVGLKLIMDGVVMLAVTAAIRALGKAISR